MWSKNQFECTSSFQVDADDWDGSVRLNGVRKRIVTSWIVSSNCLKTQTKYDRFPSIDFLYLNYSISIINRLSIFIDIHIAIAWFMLRIKELVSIYLNEVKYKPMDKKTEFERVAARRWDLFLRRIECHLPRVDNSHNLLDVVQLNARRKEKISRWNILKILRTAILPSYSVCNRCRIRSALLCRCSKLLISIWYWWICRRARSNSATV